MCVGIIQDRTWTLMLGRTSYVEQGGMFAMNQERHDRSDCQRSEQANSSKFPGFLAFPRP